MSAAVQPERTPLTPEQYAKVKQYYSDDEIRAQGYDIPGEAPQYRPGHSKFSAEQLQGRADRAVANAEDEQAAGESSGSVRALGALSSLLHDVPGMEAGQAGLRSFIRGEPYQQSLTEIGGAESDAPAYARIPARIIGGAATAAVLPSNAAQGGFLYGAAKGALDAAPDQSIADRGRTALYGGAAGAVAGRGAELGGNALLRLLRGNAPPPTGGAPQSMFGGEPQSLYDASPVATDPRSALASLLQKNLDEGMTEAYPEPASNWDLMQRIEAALRPKDLAIPRLRPH